MLIPKDMDYKMRLFFEDFDIACRKLVGQKLAIYGIGDCTRYLIDLFPEYSFVALLDKDPENVGKDFYGLPVITLQEAMDRTDAILIVSFTRLYWDIIYRRIAEETDRKATVYFMDGTEASGRADGAEFEDLGYWERSEEQLKQEIRSHDVISFDVFDTLIMRKVLVPHDIFGLVEKKLGRDFLLPRRNAETLSAISCGSCSSLEAIYDILEEQQYFESASQKAQIIQMELQTEYENIVPRQKVKNLFDYALALDKTVYMLTDMYLPKVWIEKMLQTLGITGYKELWVSCERGAGKSDGKMWESFYRHVKGSSVLHIGDNEESDIRQSEKLGIDSFHVWSSYYLLCHSSMADLSAHVLKQQDAYILGCIMQKEFNNPFILSAAKGKYQITTLEQLGYVALGPVVYSYIAWLLQETYKNRVNTILFLARDSWVNYHIYQMFVEELMLTDAPQAVYLKTSRTLATAMTVSTAEDIYELLELPYQGEFTDFLKVRFAGFKRAATERNAGTQIDTYRDKAQIVEWLQPYEEELLTYLSECRKEYKKYLHSNYTKGDKIAFSDIGYSGSNQFHLEKLMNQTGIGYYLNALLREDNPHGQNGHLKAFFQDEADLEGKRSNIQKLTLIVEAALTGPEGMYAGYDRTGTFMNLEPGMNQVTYGEKEKIHKGIKAFCRDMIQIFRDIPIKNWELSWEFPDYLLGLIFSDKCDISQEVKDTFYVDNEISGLKEKKLLD